MQFCLTAFHTITVVMINTISYMLPMPEQIMRTEWVFDEMYFEMRMDLQGHDKPIMTQLLQLPSISSTIIKPYMGRGTS